MCASCVILAFTEKKKTYMWVTITRVDRALQKIKVNGILTWLPQLIHRIHFVFPTFNPFLKFR